MELWGKNDVLSRSLSAICAIPLLVFVAIDVFSSPLHSDNSNANNVLVAAAAYLSIRLLWYAITGTNNINRDDF